MRHIFHLVLFVLLVPAVQANGWASWACCLPAPAGTAQHAHHGDGEPPESADERCNSSCAACHIPFFSSPDRDLFLISRPPLAEDLSQEQANDPLYVIEKPPKTV